MHDTKRALKHVFESLTAGTPADALAVAEVIALGFCQALRHPGLPCDVACRYYDISYGLYFVGAQRLTDMARFDSKAVVSFMEWLRRHYPPLPTLRPCPGPVQLPRVGFFCTDAPLKQGNAIAPLVRSIVVEHARRPVREIFM
jgi:hypothetical protein